MDPSSGGPCQGIRNSIPELEKLGIHNEVVCLDDSNAAFLKTDSFQIHALGLSKGPWAYNAQLLPWLVKNIERFDAIIVHGLWLYHGFATRKALQIYKKKAVRSKNGGKMPKLYVMPHGMLDPYFQKAASRRLKALRNIIYWKVIEAKVINEASGVLFTCETELELAKKTFSPYRPKQQLNVGYGIQPPPILQEKDEIQFFEKWPALKKQPYLLFLSRIHEKKGVDLLLQAYYKIVVETTETSQASYETEATYTIPNLVIAGPGLETTYGKEIKSFVDEKTELTNKVFFVGMLTGADKWAAYNNCDAFILPSHQENFGIAVVEALACSKPVLISKQVNIWKDIEASGAGLVAEDTLEGTHSLIRQWLQMQQFSKDGMNLKAKDCYKNYFSIQNTSRSFLKALS